MSERGSITVGVIVAIAGASLALGGAGGWTLRDRRADTESEAAAAALAACEAQTAPEAVRAAAGVVEAVQAPQVAEAAVRGDVARGLPVVMLGQAVVATGSPASIHAAYDLTACLATQGAGDKDSATCRTQADASAKAGAILAACSETTP